MPACLSFDGVAIMSSYDARLSALEESVFPQRQPQVCIVFGDDNAEAAVARLRSARDWPDDGAHPVDVIRVCWGKAP